MSTPVASPPSPRRALPRRHGKIRELAVQLASKKLTETNARQAVSDRIGYAVSLGVGAAAFNYGGEKAVVVALLLYAWSAVRAYNRYRSITDA